MKPLGPRIICDGHTDSPNAATAKPARGGLPWRRWERQRKHRRGLASLAQAPSVTDAVLYDLAWAQRGTEAERPGRRRLYRRLISEYPNGKLHDCRARGSSPNCSTPTRNMPDAVELLQAAVADATVDPKIRADGEISPRSTKLHKHDKAAEIFSKIPDAPKVSPRWRRHRSSGRLGIR